MDEPTAALAQQERINLYQVVNTLKELGVELFILAHIFEEGIQFADRVSVLRDGQYIVTENGENLDEKMLIKMRGWP